MGTALVKVDATRANLPNSLAGVPNHCYCNNVTRWTKSGVRRNLASCAAALVMLLLWLASFAIAASPQLHRLIHNDAQDATHRCVATMISQQSVMAGTPVSGVVPPVSFVIRSSCFADFQFLPSFDYVINDGRAPPSSFSSTTVVG